MSGLPGRLSHAPFPSRRWQALDDQQGTDAALGGDAAAHQPPGAWRRPPPASSPSAAQPPPPAGCGPTRPLPPSGGGSPWAAWCRGACGSRSSSPASPGCACGRVVSAEAFPGFAIVSVCRASPAFLALASGMFIAATARATSSGVKMRYVPSRLTHDEKFLRHRRRRAVKSPARSCELL